MGEISFLAVPTREVVGPGGDPWRVQIRGGWGGRARRPGKLQQWVDRLNWDQGELLALIPLAIFATVVLPARLWARLLYSIRRRSEWWAEAVMCSDEGDVTVAAYLEPTKQAAAERALLLLADLRAGQRGPGRSEPE